MEREVTEKSRGKDGEGREGRERREGRGNEEKKGVKKRGHRNEQEGKEGTSRFFLQQTNNKSVAIHCRFAPHT
jgi:hypothetical protein